MQRFLERSVERKPSVLGAVAVASGDDLIGHDVNVAARVADAAPAGAVLATAPLRDAVDASLGVRFGPSRSIRLKGLDDPLAVCAVEWA